MNIRCKKYGFTLVEVLAAVSMIVIIISMIYGTYFAISRSAERCNAKLILLQQARIVLKQMTRQIRCSYVEQERYESLAASSPPPAKIMLENKINYFCGNVDGSTGEILRMVTVGAVAAQCQPPNGLVEAAYKFDKNADVLYYNEKKFIGTSENGIEKINWQPVAKNIRNVELTFFDGQQWQPKWDYREQGKLPCAVRINITLEDEGRRQYQYGTVAYVCCRNGRNEKNRTDLLASVGK